MEKAAEILVIITSSVLVVFLIAAIVALIKFIQLVHSLRRISEKAEKLADSAEHIGAFFERASSPLLFSKFIRNVTQTVFHQATKGKRGHHRE